MTCIEELEISGIRSFSPLAKNQKPQKIVFHKPLTVILGKNGAGKTTIIESILNAITSAMPPGSDGVEKASFIFDPKIVGETEVKAQIRLKFKATGGQEMMVVRSFEARRTREKTTFKTLDSTLAMKDPSTGVVKSQTYRCSDVDQMVPEFLGVSRAVLQNVIFCHQEESNWPLSAPAEVKRIFDELFASTRYVAALEELRKRAKDFRAQQRDNEAQMITLKSDREQCRKMRKDIEAKEEGIRLLTMRNKEIDPRLAQLTSAIAALDAVSHNADSLMREADTLRGRIEEKERLVKQHKLPPAKQTLEQLKTMQSEFDVHIKKIRAETEQKQNQISVSELARRKAESSLAEAKNQLVLVERDDNEHKAKVVQLQKLIHDFGFTEFAVGDAQLDLKALKRIEEFAVERVTKAQTVREKEVAKYEAKLKEMREKREEVLKALESGTQERRLKEEHLKQLLLKEQSLVVSIPAGDLKAAVESTKSEVARLSAEMERELKEKASGQQSKRSETILAELASLHQKHNQLREEQGKLQQANERRAKLHFIEKQLEVQEKEFEKGMNAIINLLSELSLTVKRDISLPSLFEAVEQLKGRKAHATRTCEEESRNVDRELASLNHQLRSKRETLAEQEKELQRLRSMCSSVLGTSEISTSEYVSLLREAQETQESRSRDVATSEAMSKSYDAFVQDAKQNRQCSLCSRPLSEAELKDFIRRLVEKQKSSPEQLAAKLNELNESTTALSRLRQIEHQVHQMGTLSTSIPVLAKEVDSLTEMVNAKKALLADLGTKQRELQKQVTGVENATNQLKRLEGLDEIVKSLRSQHSGLQEGNQGSGRAAEAVAAEFDLTVQTIDKLNAELQTLQAGMVNTSGSAIQSLLLKKKEELIELQGSLRRQQELQEEHKQLATQIQVARTRLEEIASRREQLQRDLDLQNRSLTEVSNQYSSKNEELLSSIRRFEREAEQVNQLIQSIVEYLKKSSNERVQNARTAVKVAEAEANNLEKAITKLQQEITENRKILDDQHRHFADINQHIQYQTLLQEIQREKAMLTNLNAKLTELRSEQIKHVEGILGPEGLPDATVPFSKTRDACVAKKNELEQVKAQHQGSLETMLKDLADRKADLARDQYREIDRRFTVEFIKVQTIELAIQDIEKYHRALETAVSSYHQEKIAQINTIIAELWRQTYRGSDIDSIEVCSESDPSSTTSRRSYKYRVVMKRGDRELDMRGRCSAGQKVLASVIIRLALSEAFSLQCGILTLDEPTTNLDEDNARSLAEALKELINHRQGAQHFQLVVITHDEGFVRALGQGAKHGDYFYFVQKDREGAFSTITQRRYGDLLI